MSDAAELTALLSAQEAPVCAALTPFTVEAADFARGTVRLQFAEQPAFRNHFGNIQGGFSVAMVDVLLSLAVFAKVRAWLPTVEIKTSFVGPARLGICSGEAEVIRAGKQLVFAEARLWGADGKLAVHATGTCLVPPRQGG